MGNKSLYVGNLSYDVTEQELRDLFQTWGPIAETRLISERGFGFVEVPDEKAAEAILAMNGKEFKGRTLIVSEARPRPDRGGDRRGGGGRPGGYGGGGRPGGYGGGGGRGRRGGGGRRGRF